MNTKYFFTTLLLIYSIVPKHSYSQDVVDPVIYSEASTVFKQAGDDMQRISNSVTALMSKAEERRKRLEKSLLKSLGTNDFSSLNIPIKELNWNSSNTSGLTQGIYIKRLDSLKMMMSFLPVSTNSIQSIEDLQSKLSLFKKYNEEIGLRASFLKTLKSKYGKHLKRRVKVLEDLQENALRCKLQLEQIKSDLENPRKLEQRLLNSLQTSNVWKDFAQRNSELSFYFASGSTNIPPLELQRSLQTSANVVSDLNRKFSQQTKGANPPQEGYPALIRKQMANGKPVSAPYSVIPSGFGQSLGDLSFGNELLADKNVIESADRKSKSFWSRTEIGWNFQSRALNSRDRAIGLGVSFGYKLSSSLVVGFGVAQELQSDVPNTLTFVTEGTTLRSYIDGRVFKGWWLTGSYELSNLFVRKSGSSLSAIPSSFLLGLTRRVEIANKSAKIQLMADLSKVAYSRPITEAIFIRVGRNF